jgi:hypothetical protein
VGWLYIPEVLSVKDRVLATIEVGCLAEVSWDYSGRGPINGVWVDEASAADVRQVQQGTKHRINTNQ